MEFGISGLNYVTLKELKYNNLTVPEGFEFDGVTVKAPFTFLFSSKDLRKGIRASCFHDYMCRDKKNYYRQYATKVLVDIWKEDGLSPFKAWIVKITVNAFQAVKGGWKD